LEQCDEVDQGRALKVAFAKLKEIHGSLHIINSDILSALSFLTNLRVIHGTKANQSDTSGTSLEVAWNGQLNRLWGSNSHMVGERGKLRIMSGRLVFSLNRNLCPAEIHRFIQSHIQMTRNLTNLELNLIDRSNGDVALSPPNPIGFRATALSSSDIRLQWSDAEHTNGPLVEVLVWHAPVPETVVVAHEDSVSCGQMSLGPVNSIEPLETVKQLSTVHRPTPSCTFCAVKCRSNVSDETSVRAPDYSHKSKELEAGRWKQLESILFEDRLQNLLLSPRGPNTLSRRATRSLPLASDATASWLKGAHLIVVPRTPNTDTPSVSGSSHHVMVHNLRHFTAYSFRLLACHRPHDTKGQALKIVRFRH
uniref:Recep_L_domain domain-containing protein n=1 Tax=Echinostoma caproni TaxID=27848 RepID=A0A183AUS0_9TREM